MGRTKSYYDLRDALAQPGCAVCRLKNEAVDRSLDVLLWESVNDPQIRDRIRQARGLCYDHSWDLVRNGASLGSTIIAHDVLRNILRILEAARFQPPATLSLRRTREALDPKEPKAATADLVAQLAPQAPCPACTQAKEMEDIYLSSLLKHVLHEEELLAAFEASDGLCLPHLGQALAQVGNETLFEILVKAQADIWEGLDEHLREIIRKSDYRFKDEVPGEESGAGLRAVAALAGSQKKRGRV
jgi:hypothetical protein